MRRSLTLLTTIPLLALGLFVLPQPTYAQVYHAGECSPAETSQGYETRTYVDNSGLGQSTDCMLPGSSSGSVTSAATYGTSTPSDPTSCSGLVNFWSKPVTCIGRSISAIIGSALITVTVWLLQIMGELFNWLMYYTVVAYGDQSNGFLTPGVHSAINSVWTVFRDLANILIIGLFVFIAISIILGLKEYGQKKLIARALIIAVLINFSLLFTKMIIDGSNFVAYQLYSATNVGGEPIPTGTSATQIANAAVNFNQNGVAGQFIQFMGVTSITNTFKTLQDGADAVNNGWITLLHGLFGATLLLAAALVLLYGCYLLTVRAVLMIFLLITSSVAFASYLVPKLSEGEYGWSAWWKALLSNAVFAPLLVLLLWATLKFAQALQPKGGTLGALLSEPTNAGNLSALFSYIIVLGLLFGSLKIASSFSGKIGGFNFTGLNLMRLAVAPMAIGNRLLAPVARQTLGRNAAARARDAEVEVKEELARAAAARAANAPYDMGKLTSAIKKQQTLESRAKSDFQVGAIKRMAEATQLGALANAKAIGGFLGPKQKAAEEAAKKVSGLSVSKEKVGELVAESIKQAQAPERDAIQLLQRTATAQLQSAQATADAAKQSERLEERRIAAEQHARSEREDATRQKNDIEEQHRRGAIDRAERNRRIQEQDERIKAAHEAIQTIGERASQIDALHLTAPKQEIDRAENRLRELDRELQASVQEQTKTALNKGADVLKDVAVDLSHAHGITADIIRDQVGKQVKNKRVKDRIKLEKEVTREVDGEETPPATT